MCSALLPPHPASAKKRILKYLCLNPDARLFQARRLPLPEPQLMSICKMGMCAVRIP